MRAIADLTGRFGRLLILEKFPGSAWKAQYRCICDCGNEKLVRGTELIKGDTKSCGCLRSPDLTGQRHGKLTVIGRSKYRNGRTCWSVRCDCGVVRNITAGNFIRQLTCGCSLDIKYVGMINKYGCEIVEDLGKINGSRKFLVKCTCGNTYYCNQGDFKRHISCGCKTGLRRTLRTGKGIGGFNCLYSGYKRRADRKHLDFCLTKEEFRKITESSCYYCSSEPKQKMRATTNFSVYTYNGIDRLDNNLGYTVENCVPCCGTCNAMKLELSEKEFYDRMLLILKTRGIL